MDERCKVYSDEYPLGFVLCGSPAEAEAIRACLGVGRVETGRFDRRAEKKQQDAADRAAAKRAKMSKAEATATSSFFVPCPQGLTFNELTHVFISPRKKKSRSGAKKSWRQMGVVI